MRILKIRKRNLFRTLIIGFGEFDFWRRCQMPAPTWILEYYKEEYKATRDGTIYRFSEISEASEKFVMWHLAGEAEPTVQYGFKKTFYDDSLGNVFK